MGEVTTAKVVSTCTPEAFSNDAADRDKQEIRATLSVSAEDLSGITEPATVYLYHGTKAGSTSGGSVAYYPITWTCSPDNPELDGRIPKFLLAGDSTCRNYKESEAPQAGWGQYLADALGGIATVNNHAIGGYSTKRFIIDGYWDKLCAEIVKGDIVIIQFGHNDFSTQDVKHTVPYGPSDELYGSFQDNLRKMVADVQAKGGLPILSTSTTKCELSGNTPLPTVGEYPASMRQVASEDEILLIDINTTMMAWLKSVGRVGAEPYYILDKKGGNDTSHITHEGAKLVATWVAQGLVDLRVWHHPIVDLTQAQE